MSWEMVFDLFLIGFAFFLCFWFRKESRKKS